MHNQVTNFDTDGNELTIQKCNAHTETKLKKMTTETNTELIPTGTSTIEMIKYRI